MKAFWSAMLVMVAIAVVSAVVLQQFEMSAESMNSTSSVRLN